METAEKVTFLKNLMPGSHITSLAFFRKWYFFSGFGSMPLQLLLKHSATADFSATKIPPKTC